MRIGRVENLFELNAGVADHANLFRRLGPSASAISSARHAGWSVRAALSRAAASAEIIVDTTPQMGASNPRYRKVTVARYIHNVAAVAAMTDALLRPMPSSGFFALGTGARPADDAYS